MTLHIQFVKSDADLFPVYTNALLLTLNARTMVRETGKQSTLSYTVPLSGIIARVPGSGTLESSIDTPRMAEVGSRNASTSLLEGKTPPLVIVRTASVPGQVTLHARS